MLPDNDVDVDIDDLIDDEDEEEEDEIAADDLTTDDEERHPTTSSSSSPPPTDRVDDDASAAAAAAGESTDSETNAASQSAASPTSEHDDDMTHDKTSELSDAELQSDVQPPSINVDDVTPTTTGEPGDDLPDQSTTADELEVTDTSRRDDSGETAGRDQSHEDKDAIISSAENRQETCNDEEVQVCSPDANQQVCQSIAAESSESDDVIPSASSAASAEVSTSSLSTSLEQAQHAEAVEDAPQQELKPTTEDEAKDEAGDAKCTAETADQTETRQNESDVTEENDKNHLEVTSQSEKQGEDDHEPDFSTTPTEEDHSTKETQELSIDDEKSTGDLEQRSLSREEDEVTSRQDSEEVKVAEESEVTEEAKVTEEVKVITYEASAKQLDLLSRLAMLREKAVQRKSQQPSDEESTQDSQGTSSGEPSVHRDDITGPHDQSDSLPQRQKGDVTRALTTTDVSRRAVDRDQDKQTTSEADRQTIDTDVKQQCTEVTGSSSPSLTTHDDTVGTETRTQDADNSSRPPSERKSLSTTDESTTPLHSDRRDVSTAKVSSLPSETDNDRSDDVSTSTREDASVREQPQETRSTTEDTHEQQNQIDSSAQRGSGQPGLSETPPDAMDSETSGATAVVDFNQPSVPVDSESQNTTDQADRARLSNSGIPGTATADMRSESVTSPSLPDTASNAPTASTDTSCVTAGSTEPSGESTDDDDTAAANYDSDLDIEFADTAAVQLISDIQTLKSSTADGPGHLYVFADTPRRRFKIGASRSPAKRLRQAIALNPDISLLISTPVSRRLAAVRELRRRLSANDVTATCLPRTRDWFTCSDDVITERVRQVAAADTTNN